MEIAPMDNIVHQLEGYYQELSEYKRDLSIDYFEIDSLLSEFNAHVFQNETKAFQRIIEQYENGLSNKVDELKLSFQHHGEYLGSLREIAEEIYKDSYHQRKTLVTQTKEIQNNSKRVGEDVLESRDSEIHRESRNSVGGSSDSTGVKSGSKDSLDVVGSIGEHVKALDHFEMVKKLKKVSFRVDEEDVSEKSPSPFRHPPTPFRHPPTPKHHQIHLQKPPTPKRHPIPAQKGSKSKRKSPVSKKRNLKVDKSHSENMMEDNSSPNKSDSKSEQTRRTNDLAMGKLGDAFAKLAEQLEKLNQAEEKLVRNMG